MLKKKAQETLTFKQNLQNLENLHEISFYIFL